MTDLEIAEAQIKKWDSLLYPQMYPVALVKDFIRKAYLEGLKAGRPQWHDLQKDKNDLPKLDKADMSDYVITDKGVAYYNGRVKSWFIQNEYILTDDVIAWSEIPTFDKE